MSYRKGRVSLLITFLNLCCYINLGRWHLLLFDQCLLLCWHVPLRLLAWMDLLITRANQGNRIGETWKNSERKIRVTMRQIEKLLICPIHPHLANEADSILVQGLVSPCYLLLIIPLYKAPWHPVELYLDINLRRSWLFHWKWGIQIQDLEIDRSESRLRKASRKACHIRLSRLRIHFSLSRL